MNHLTRKKSIQYFITIIGSLVMSISCVYAAKITIDAPKSALGNRQPITVQLFLDANDDVVSGISGSFSFPADLFTIDSLSNQSSIVSLWVTQPAPSQEKYIDGRTHITFEGIFPGGYRGVRSPYYQGYKPGLLFSVTLIPKNKGQGTFVVDDLILNAYNQDATPLPIVSVIQDIRVPELTGPVVSSSNVLREITSKTLTAFITRDQLVNRNAWYLVVNDQEEKSPISQVYVVENDSYSASLVNDRRWRAVTTPYVLFYQDRTKYIHVKVLYANNTYALLTLPPVENSKSISGLSRILVSVIIVLSLLYFYGKKLFIASFEKP